MLKVDEAWLQDADKQYPGIKESIDYCESLPVPPCPKCGSTKTAEVICGVIGRTIHVAAATTKVKLVPRRDANTHYCEACGVFFRAEPA